ncbi:MAG TPA: hypothetical protein DIT64_13635 [Verrucomicrobiales bacterium]|nr:hypothetical protein [Verrucomicrobiales bacterium]HCN77189.1 hypothetical protein [Verrucomicrobiales bacterium]HRJ08811.1 hypothetical protein [Prosthecobacter sp.]HRK13751.1 hypothetical protein [Prosthecobacter sp.]
MASEAPNHGHTPTWKNSKKRGCNAELRCPFPRRISFFWKILQKLEKMFSVDDVMADLRESSLEAKVSVDN